GHAGRLGILMDMPADVVLEIAFQPIDVLHLVRESRGLRELMMSKRAVAAWQAALQNIPGLYPCSLDISEPLYSELDFDRACMVRTPATYFITYLVTLVRRRARVTCRKAHCMRRSLRYGRIQAGPADREGEGSHPCVARAPHGRQISGDP
ncbi:hypothetical protein OBBRIDRAFT_736933, partial [Obba rivulosa]